MSRRIISLGRQAAAAARTQISPAKTLPGLTETIKEVTASEQVTTMSKQDVCWMRDPKTGYWLPENSFDEVDAAELRAKLINQKK